MRPLPTLDLGTGNALLIMHGFGLQPRTYEAAAALLAERCRVLLPSLLVPTARRRRCARRSWSPLELLDALVACLDERGVERFSVVGHSFGGALELELAVRVPERITELVFVDTLAMSREWKLAAEALHPVHLLWMATPRAAVDFAASAASHPLCLARAAWWGFRSDRRSQVATLAASGTPCHVLWAARDSLLSRADGAAFAADLRADFKVVRGPSGKPVDHDWFYRHPALLREQLEALGLAAFGTPRVALRGGARPGP